MILILTLIKDMVVSMYHKIKNKQWFTNAFSKAKQSDGGSKKGKIVEGFVACETLTAVHQVFVKK